MLSRLVTTRTRRRARCVAVVHILAVQPSSTRRTYGGTDNIVLDFRMGEHFMGEEGIVWYS